jgi:hypothetical protein
MSLAPAARPMSDRGDSAGGGFTGMLTLSLVGVLASLLLILTAYPRRHDHVDHPVMVDPLGEDLTRPDTA